MYYNFLKKKNLPFFPLDSLGEVKPMIKFGEVIGGESFRWDLLLQIPSSEDLSSSLSLLRPAMLGKPETEAFEFEAAELPPPQPVDEAGPPDAAEQ